MHLRTMATMCEHPSTCCSHNNLTSDWIPANKSLKSPLGLEFRKDVYQAILDRKDGLKDVSLYLHDNPELNYEEYKAHAKLTEYLEKQGFEVHKSFKLETAFKATYTRGRGGPTFGINSEFDALPGIGHACGHNLIAISGVAALEAIRYAMEKHDIEGTVVLLGTPAEEGGAGKVKLLDAGAYEGIDACMMIHPAGPAPNGMDGDIRPTLAVRTLFVEFKGAPAHAMVAPWQGKNALDAANIAYMSISSMRQQLRKTDYVHGIIVNGGQAANIIPEYTSMQYYCRSDNSNTLEVLMNKIVPCFKAAAMATGCEVTLDIGGLRADVRHSQPLADEYAATMYELFQKQLSIDLSDEAEPLGSTDFGNVSYTMPSCHPTFLITNEPRLGHTAEFAIETRKRQAHEATYQAASAIASTGLRFLTDPEFAKQVRLYWKTDMEKVGGQ